jgi:hypothetical protein
MEYLFSEAIIQAVSQNTQGYIDTAIKIIGIVGGLIAAFKAISEIREGRILRERDYRWKQTNAAKELIDAMMNDKLALAAASMLDWDKNIYFDDNKRSFMISHQEVVRALRIENLKFSSKEKFIRDAFDKFLNYLEFMEQFIKNDLFKYEDILYPIEYYIRAAKEKHILDALEVYIKEYNFNNSELFIKRFTQKK